MKRIRIYPFKLGSASARSLAVELDSLCVKPDGNYRPRDNDLIINWGNSHEPDWWQYNYSTTLNNPTAVKHAVNKLATFQKLLEEGVPTPRFTTQYSVAYRWMIDGLGKVVTRSTLTGTRGEGIEIHDGTYSFEDYPLYVEFIPRAREYRVHVFDGQVIDLQQKKRREGNDSDGTIKNLDNGWVFVRDDITQPPREIFDIAIRSVNALGLDFGAVDIITKEGRCYVLEVNTACGLEGTTLSSYVNAIKRYATE